MLNRESRQKYAVKHTSEMYKKYPSLIDISIKNSIIYSENNFLNENINEKMNIVVDPIDSVSAILKYKNKNKKIAVLNFASYKNPGGGFLGGSIAQEEALCAESYLYNVLKEFENSFYEENRKDVNSALYKNRGIYSPNVLFMRDDTREFCDVITIACPNKKAARDFYDVSESYNKEILRKRIEFVLNVAKSNSVEILILGAFGCGVFGQNPEEVAEIFKEFLENEFKCFETVVFAIPEGKNKNLKEFKKVFKK